MFVVANEALGAKGAALDVTGEVTQGGAAATGVLEVDVPLLGG